ALAAKADETDEGVRAYRIGGDEFVLLCRCDQKRGELLCGEVRELLREGNAHDITPPVCVSMGLAHGRAPLEVEALLRQADGRMYEEKRKNKESLR
ncbi:MAG: diguanylate cyclase, partial [Oscillospiraceae bacterium]